jgi:hypothetical protein
MPDEDRSPRSFPSEPAESPDDRGPSGPKKSRLGSDLTTIKITGIVIAVLLALGVVVAALDMKFEADQARWQQRQTCLDWYRLQAEYGLGPWYEKLPAAAADCGGAETDDGVPAVPGGSRPAIVEADVPDGATTTTLPSAGP